MPLLPWQEEEDISESVQHQIRTPTVYNYNE